MGKPNLRFKYGEFKNLPQAKSDGTIYVTSDEKAMYVDLDGSRIRIGDIIVRDGIKDVKPPFTVGAFYYFVTENALCRFDGEKWVQINNTEGLKTSIDNVASQLTNLGKTLGDRIDDHDTKIADIEKVNTAQGKEIDVLKAAVGTAPDGTNLIGKIAALETATENLGKQDKTLQDNIDTVSGAASENTNAITELTKKVEANKGSIGTINTTIANHTSTLETHETDISGLKTLTGTHGTDIEALKKKDETLSNAISTNTESITNNQTSISSITETIGKNKSEETASTGLYKVMEEKIASALQAADAMTFKGVINSDSELPSDTSNIHAGDTYKIATQGAYSLTLEKSQQCKVGDLLIAEKDNQRKWVYVPSGGEDHDHLSLVTKNNTITLSDDTSNPELGHLGSVTIGNSNNLNLSITTVASSISDLGVKTPGQINFNLVWDTF